VRYCNSECQRTHWKLHKGECKIRPEATDGLEAKKQRTADLMMTVGRLHEEGKFLQEYEAIQTLLLNTFVPVSALQQPSETLIRALHLRSGVRVKAFPLTQKTLICSLFDSLDAVDYSIGAWLDVLEYGIALRWLKHQLDWPKAIKIAKHNGWWTEERATRFAALQSRLTEFNASETKHDDFHKSDLPPGFSPPLRAKSFKQDLEDDSDSYYAALMQPHPGLVLRHDERCGRSLFAARDFKKGELVLIEQCYATAVFDCRETKTCASCLHVVKATQALVECEHKCGDEVYCSKTCRDRAAKMWHRPLCGKVDWKQLRAEVSQGKTTSSRFPLMYLKLLGMALSLSPSKSIVQALPQIDKLVAVTEVAPLLKISCPPFCTQYDLLRECAPTLIKANPLTDFESWYDVFGRLVPNSAGDKEAQWLASVYCFFAHSCEPSCQFTRARDLIAVTAGRDIAKGELLTIAYIDVKKDINQRAVSLLHYGITCACTKCAKETRLVTPALKEHVAKQA